MKKIIILSFLLILSITSNSQSRFFSTKGNDIIDPSGSKIVLKGINLGNWLVPEGYMFKFKSANSPLRIYEVFNELLGNFEAEKFWKKYRDTYITKDDIKFIKESGFNSVRVPFNYRLFVVNDNPAMLEGPGYELLDKVISWCKEENLYAVLDMHCAPGGQTGDNIDDSYGYPYLFESKEAQELTSAVWIKLAERYKDETIIIGYDLLNEPIAHYFDSTYFNPKLEPLYKELVAAVRKVDKNHICFLGGAQWDSNFKVFGAPFDPLLVYTFHKYWTEPGQEVIQDYLDFSAKHNVPLWMGESGENSYEWINAFRHTLEKNEVSWCFWPYKKLDAESCIASVNMPEGFDKIVDYANSDRSTFQKIREEKPSKEEIEKALSPYLENIKFENCKINNGYLDALFK